MSNNTTQRSPLLRARSAELRPDTPLAGVPVVATHILRVHRAIAWPLATSILPPPVNSRIFVPTPQ
jgi:hypothetical protein